MIYYREWQTEKPSKSLTFVSTERKFYYYYSGWFLFCFIPLYIKRVG